LPGVELVVLAGRLDCWPVRSATGVAEELSVINTIPASHATLRTKAKRAAVALLIAGSLTIPASGLAAPGLPHGTATSQFQNVDYISAEDAAALDLGFTVLVPGWVPSPFGGSPSIDAGGGYYSLYWMNSGGSPTFLQVEGQVGGSLPAGSPYDLNNQLSINATVQGYAAINDVTPAYDAVWWIAGGVLYKVESLNMGTSSLDLANSLVAFQAPSAPEPEPTDIPVVAPTDPPVDEPAVQEPEESAGGSQEELVVDESEAQADEPATSTADESSTGESATDGGDGTTADEPTSVPSDGTGEPFVTSDGTGGASVPAIGSDGTGGTIDVVARRPQGGSGTPNP
jgi:hypothetical protein